MCVCVGGVDGERRGSNRVRMLSLFALIAKDFFEARCEISQITKISPHLFDEPVHRVVLARILKFCFSKFQPGSARQFGHIWIVLESNTSNMICYCAAYEIGSVKSDGHLVFRMIYT